jgi:uncharacterized protein (TIGR02284 family)
VFEKFATDSRQNVQELTSAVNRIGGEAETGTSGTGSIHRAWIDVKATFTGHDRKSVLAECERGEDAIKKAYQSALTENDGLPADVLQVVIGQQQKIVEGHDKIKALRDSQVS